MRDGWYIACPRCGEISEGDNWMLFVHLWTTERILVRENGSMERVEFGDAYPNLRYLKHECGDGKEFRSTEYTEPEDFLINISGGKIVNFGRFYRDNPEKLAEICEKNGFVVGRE